MLWCSDERIRLPQVECVSRQWYHHGKTNAVAKAISTNFMASICAILVSKLVPTPHFWVTNFNFVSSLIKRQKLIVSLLIKRQKLIVISPSCHQYEHRLFTYSCKGNFAWNSKSPWHLGLCCRCSRFSSAFICIYLGHKLSSRKYHITAHWWQVTMISR